MSLKNHLASDQQHQFIHPSITEQTIVLKFEMTLWWWGVQVLRPMSAGIGSSTPQDHIQALSGRRWMDGQGVDFVYFFAVSRWDTMAVWPTQHCCVALWVHCVLPACAWGWTICCGRHKLQIWTERKSFRLLDMLLTKLTNRQLHFKQQHCCVKTPFFPNTAITSWTPSSMAFY